MCSTKPARTPLTRMAVIGVVAVSGVGCSTSNSHRPPVTSSTPVTTSGAPDGTSSTSEKSAPTPPQTTTSSLSPPTTSVTAVTEVRSCSSANLTLSWSFVGGGGGRNEYGIVLTNRAATCSVAGYPGVSFLGPGFAQIGSPATRTPTAPATLLSLPPGQSVNATVIVSPNKCVNPPTSVMVRVFPPDQTTPLYAKASVLVCSPEVTALVPGAHPGFAP